MKKSPPLFPPAFLFLFLAACNLSTEDFAPLAPMDSGGASTQTYVAVQWQTLAAWQAAQTAQSLGTPFPSVQPPGAETGTAAPPDASTSTWSPTVLAGYTYTPSFTRTGIPSLTATATGTSSATVTATGSYTPTVTATSTSSSTVTPTATASSTIPPSGTSSPTGTPTQTASRSPTPTRTASPTITPSKTNTSTKTATPTLTLTPIPCNWAQFIADINYPDDSEMSPSDHFTKTWRLKNIGSCTWTSGYSLVFDHGDRMDAPDAKPLTSGTVAPGATVDVSVDLLTPADPGTYQGFFKLRAPDDTTFGIGSGADGAFWIKIIVVPPVVDPSTQSVYEQVTLAPGITGSTTAVCPAGTAVTGGGFSVAGDVYVYTQVKNGNGWSVFAKNNSAANRALTAYAICLTFPSVSTSHVAQNASVNGGGSLANKTVDCPAGTVAVGGGFTGISDGSVWTFFSTLSGNGWEVSVRNFGGVTRSFQVMAVCLSGATLTASNATAEQDIAAGGSGFAEVSCPSGQVITGGGWHMEVDLQVYYASWYSGKWRVYAKNTGSYTRALTARGVCVGRP